MNNNTPNSTLEFVSGSEAKKLISPWHKPKASAYEDQILKPEYQARRLRFNAGTTWIRIVPSIKGSSFDWAMPLDVLNYPGGRLLHPRTLDPNARCAHDEAYKWIHNSHPASLFSKDNKGGARLLPDSMVLMWALVEENGKLFARLILASDYDSSRGGVCGLGHEICRIARELDEDSELVADAINPENGFMLSIDKSQPKGARFPTYSVRLGRQSAPLQPLLDKLDHEERAALVPLENTVAEISREDQWRCLGKVIAQEHVERIRTDVERAA